MELLLQEEGKLLDEIQADLTQLGNPLGDDESKELIAMARMIPSTIDVAFPPGQPFDPVKKRAAIGTLVASVVHSRHTARGLQTEYRPERAAEIRLLVEDIPYIKILLDDLPQG